MLTEELISCTILSGYNIQKDLENARFHSAFFTYEESMINDGLIHLLASGDISFAYSCNYRICREFSLHYGESPMHYLNSRRIAAAKRLLLTTDLNIREVCAQVGIENTNHFINLFKIDTGTTPLSFKQAAPVSISDLHYN